MTIVESIFDSKNIHFKIFCVCVYFYNLVSVSIKNEFPRKIVVCEIKIDLNKGRLAQM